MNFQHPGLVPAENTACATLQVLQDVDCYFFGEYIRTFSESFVNHLSWIPAFVSNLLEQNTLYCTECRPNLFHAPKHKYWRTDQQQLVCNTDQFLEFLANNSNSP